MNIDLPNYQPFADRVHAMPFSSIFTTTKVKKISTIKNTGCCLDTRFLLVFVCFCIRIVLYDYKTSCLLSMGTLIHSIYYLGPILVNKNENLVP